MIKELDTELRESIKETMPLVNDVFDVLLKHSGNDSAQIKILAKAFEDMGIQYDINFKVAAIKKNFEDLEIMLKDLLEVKSSE